MDCNELLSAYEKLGNTSLYLEDSDGDCCVSTGVKCNNQSRITSLVLNKKRLSGFLPPELSRMPELVNISFQFNSLTGRIPDEWSQMPKIEMIQLYANQLVGGIPPSFSQLKTIKMLQVARNRLTEPLSPLLGQIQSLEWFSCADNMITGTLPPELGNLSNLQFFAFVANRIHGSIPSSFGNLKNLKDLAGTENLLTGSLPTELGDCTALENIYINDNQINGTIPPSLGKLKHLNWIYLANNSLSGPLPPELANAPIQKLILYSNKFTQGIPESYGQMPLDQIDLRNTSLAGPAPGNWTLLQLQDCAIDPTICSPKDNPVPALCGERPICPTIVYQMPWTAIVSLVFGSLVLIGLFFSLIYRLKHKKTPKPDLTIAENQVQMMERIGSGGFGQVYVALLNGERVAVKRISSLSKNAEQSLLQEAAIMKSLNHPRVLPLYGISMQDGQWSLVMQLMHCSLYDYIRRNTPLATQDKNLLLRDVSSALGYLHMNRIIHRDLKSPNILLDTHQRAKVCDFGLSLVRSEASSKIESNFAGTVVYMAPECFGLQPVYSEKSDVYAFSMVVYELLAWELPYTNMSQTDIKHFVLEGKRPQIRDADHKLTQMMQDCWQEDPKTRPSFAQLTERLSA
ncbi:kinase-like domain-containing protein [Gorgonomyces haynaldii]|nr:kinase-like domain-containing protein [Gorgonomyces haynaldii]